MLPISEDEMRPLPSWCAGRWDGEGGEVEVGEVDGLVWRDGIGGGSGRRGERQRVCVSEREERVGEERERESGRRESESESESESERSERVRETK